MPQCRARELDRDDERDLRRSGDLERLLCGLKLRLPRLPSDEYDGDLARRERFPPLLVESGLEEYLRRRLRGSSLEDTEETERRLLFDGGDRLPADWDR